MDKQASRLFNSSLGAGAITYLYEEYNLKGKRAQLSNHCREMCVVVTKCAGNERQRDVC